MKYLFSILLIISSGLVTAENTSVKNEISFKSTFPEGFGILIKKDLVIMKVNSNPSSKGGDVKNIYIVINAGSKDTLLLVSVEKEIREKLEEHFKDNQQLKITGIGYESICVSGVPAISRSVRDEEIDGLQPAALPGWGAEKVFELMWFRLR